MTKVFSTLEKDEDGLGFILRANLGQVSGLGKHLTRAEFNAAVTLERSRITDNGAGVFSADEPCSIVGEVGTRRWLIGGSAAASHWRAVEIAGRRVVLVADANTITLTTGAPTGNGTTSGDKRLDPTTGLLYTWTTVWDAGVQFLPAVTPTGSTPTPPIQVSTSRALAESDNSRILECTATATLTVPAGLPAGFRCVVIPFGTTTVAFSSTTGNGSAASITRAASANAMFGITQRGSAASSYVVDGV